MLGPERGDRAGVQPEQPSAGRVKLQPAGGQHPQHMGVRHQGHVPALEQRADPGQHAVRAFTDRLDGLTGVVGVSRDHPVPPQRPARPLVLDLLRGPALVAAVVPFPQVRVEMASASPASYAVRTARWPGW